MTLEERLREAEEVLITDGLDPEGAAVGEARCQLRRITAASELLIKARNALKQAQKRGDGHAETLRGIVSMNPETEGNRMRQWARDGLSGYVETIEATVKIQQDRIEQLQTARWSKEPPDEPGEYYLRVKIPVTNEGGTLCTVDAIGDRIAISEIDYGDWWPDPLPAGDTRTGTGLCPFCDHRIANIELERESDGELHCNHCRGERVTDAASDPICKDCGKTISVIQVAARKGGKPICLNCFYVDDSSETDGDSPPCDHKGHMAKDDDGKDYCTFCNWPETVPDQGNDDG